MNERSADVVNMEKEEVNSNEFGACTKHRSFKFVVEDKIFYVNPFALAEWSPFFDTLCTGPYAEGVAGEAIIQDVKYDDFVELLQVLGLADVTKLRKEVSILNCQRMLTLADRWEVEYINGRCNNFIENELPAMRTSFRDTFELLVCYEKHGSYKRALSILASRLASFGNRVLTDNKVFDQIQNGWLCAAIAVAAASLGPGMPSPPHWVDLHKAGTHVCNVSGCRAAASKCDFCQQCMCITHSLAPCSELALGQQSDKNVSIDRRFFDPEN